MTGVENGWEAVFKRLHCLLAGQIDELFRDGYKPEFWVETLSAILSRDNHNEPSNARHYVTDLGAPKDFTLVAYDAS